MRAARIARLARVVRLVKMAELARVAANRAAARTALSRAQDHRSAARRADPAGDPAGMEVLGRWQRTMEARARAEEGSARALDNELRELRPVLARAIGRETALEALQGRLSAAARLLAERRTEDVPRRSAQSSVSRRPASSAGTE